MMRLPPVSVKVVEDGKALLIGEGVARLLAGLPVALQIPVL